MAYGFFSSCCPRIALVAVLDALVEIWNGRDQSGPLKIGDMDNLFFISIKETWQSWSQSNSEIFQSNENKGDVILVKCSINWR